jgi:hypothetical protein
MAGVVAVLAIASVGLAHRAEIRWRWLVWRFHPDESVSLEDTARACAARELASAEALVRVHDSRRGDTAHSGSRPTKPSTVSSASSRSDARGGARLARHRPELPPQLDPETIPIGPLVVPDR